MRYLFVLLLLSSTALAQPITQTQALVAIGKVWGFLKYYHPQVATGKVDWDGQLIQLIEESPTIHPKADLSARLLQWVNQLSSAKPCSSCSPPDSARFARNLELSWLADSSLFSPALCQALGYVAANRNQRNNHYVHWDPFHNRLAFSKAEYAAMALPSVAYRLLWLFRYWNIIEFSILQSTLWLNPGPRCCPSLFPVFNRLPIRYAINRFCNSSLARPTTAMPSSSSPRRIDFLAPNHSCFTPLTTGCSKTRCW